MGIHILTVTLAGVAGFFCSVVLFGAIYFITNGNILSHGAATLLLAVPIAMGFPYGYRVDKALPENYAFASVMLATEAILLGSVLSLASAALIVGGIAVAGAIVGMLTRIWGFQLPGIPSGKFPA